MKTPDHAIRTTYGEQKAQYVVFAEGGDAPTKRHPERWMAEKEAERMAAKNPGTEFHVAKLKRSLVIGEARPPVDANFERQMTARAEMGPGMWVKVRSTHHRHAGEIGYITSFGDGETDSSVYVKIGINAPPLRFSPSSLMVQSRTGFKAADDDAPKHDDAEGPSIFGSLASIAARALLHSAARAAMERGSDEAIDRGPTDSAAADEAYAKGRAIPVGTEIMVIHSTGMGLLPGTAFTGRMVGPDPDDRRMAIVDLYVGRDKAEVRRETVNASRVMRADDESVVVLG